MGIYGMSYGGMVAEMCRRDERLKCVALMDAAGNLQLPSTGLQKPFLCMHAPDNEFLTNTLSLFNKATNNATWLLITNSVHLTFSNMAWAMQIPWGRPLASAINDCMLWFFDTYLKGETSEFPTNPELYDVRRK